MTRGERVLGERQFRHFKIEQLRRQSGFAERSPERSVEIASPKLSWREVDRDDRWTVGSYSAPNHRFAAGLFQYPGSDWNNQSGFFCQRDEFCRRNQSANGVSPADECLKAMHESSVKTHDRLVVELEIAAIDGVSKIGFGSKPSHGPLVCRRIETSRLSPAERLGFIHRDIGLT